VQQTGDQKVLPSRRTVGCGKELGPRVCHRLAEFLRARGSVAVRADPPEQRRPLSETERGQG